MFESISKYLKYSGVWLGITVNPFHWQFGWKNGYDLWNEYLFDNSVHIGPLWIRVVIDDGKW